MPKSENDLLAENVLGEAVLKLIEDKQPIGWATLIATLEEFAASSMIAARREACLKALRDVRVTAEQKVPDSLIEKVNDHDSSVLAVMRRSQDDEEKH